MCPTCVLLKLRRNICRVEKKTTTIFRFRTAPFSTILSNWISLWNCLIFNTINILFASNELKEWFFYRQKELNRKFQPSIKRAIFNLCGIILGIFIQSTWPEIPFVKIFLFRNLINPILLKKLDVSGLKNEI